MGRKTLDGGVYGGNDVGGWGGAEDSGSPLDVDVYGGEHEDVDGPLQLQNSYVGVGVRSRAESGEVVPDPFPNSLKVVH